MSDWINTITQEVTNSLDTRWDTRDGYTIPETEKINLTNGAVKIEATFLYADLAGSSILAEHCPWPTTAKIIRTYLEVCTRLIRAYGGEIRSFDGDRVMGVFIGNNKNTYATNCAREIDWVVEKIIAVKTKKFPSIKEKNIQIKHCIGIDTGEVIAVRAGIRNSNDLIWIGKAASMAAKLSDIRNYPYSVYISNSCYLKLPDSSKITESGDKIWEQTSYDFAGVSRTIYHTKNMKEP